MKRALLPAWSGLKPVIGMVHLAPLPGSPRARDRMKSVRSAALRDTEALIQGGVHGIILENFGDAPFFPGPVPPHTVAQMTSLAWEIRRQVDIPLGINVLRNDGRAALAVAHAVGADFIRVNILAGARVTDQGIIEGIAHDLLRDRHVLDAESISIFADVQVKHSAPLAEYGLKEDVEDVIQRAGADAVIVSGSGTGKAVDPDMLRQVAEAAGEAPVLAGSGLTPSLIPLIAHLADGFIVGTYIKRDGKVFNPVDPNRVRELVSSLPRA